MSDELKDLTASIVANYVANNTISVAALPALIQSTYAALSAANDPSEPEPEPTAKATAAQIRKSITPDALISFEDGKPYKSMKRHLSGFGLTPAAYREKWGLAKDYPMVSPSYSAARSALAKTMGLGSKGRQTQPAPTSAPVKAPRTAKADAKAAPKGKVGRPPKAIAPKDETFS